MRDPFDDLRLYAEHLESSVPYERARVRVVAAMQPRRHTPRKAVTALATVAIMGFSNVALAAAADPSAPGDALYGLDRAYERIGAAVGVGGDHRFERIEEASELAGRGESEIALALVIEALEGLVDDDARTARAVLAWLETGADVIELNEQIQLMIDIARTSAEDARDQGMKDAAGDLTGSGLDIAEIARRIRDSVDLPEQSSQETPGDASPEKPDKVDKPGKPDDSTETTVSETTIADDTTTETTVVEDPTVTSDPSDDSPGQSEERGRPDETPSDTRPAKDEAKKNG